jgi:prevent-host-death family protein
LGKYRVLFNIDENAKEVTIVTVGEKKANSLVIKERSLLRIMVIPLSEAKTNLSHYGRMCQDQPVIVTVKGVPAFQLVPVDKDDDLIDGLLQKNAKLRQKLVKRLSEPSVSLAQAKKRLSRD